MRRHSVQSFAFLKIKEEEKKTWWKCCCKEPEKKKRVPVSRERVMELWRKARVKIMQWVRMRKVDVDAAEANVQKHMAKKIISQNKMYVLHPNSPTRKFIDITMSFIIMLEIFSVYYIYFVQKEKTYTISNVTTVFLSLMIIVKFISGFKKDTYVVMNLKEVAIHYLKTYFIFDFLATIPLYLAYEPLYVLRLFRVVRFNDALSLVLYANDLLINALVMISKRKLVAINRLFKLGMNLIILMHVLATIWVGLGYFDEGWIDTKEEGGYLVDQKESTVYIAAIYWVITTFTTVGYGDFAGNNTEEFFYQMTIQMIGIMIFSYLMGNMNSIVEKGDVDIIAAQVEELELWMVQLDQANKEKILSTAQCEIMTNFFIEYWYHDVKSIDQNEFFYDLNPQLRNQLLIYLFTDIRTHFEKYFEPLRNGCKMDLILAMEYYRFEKLPTTYGHAEPIIRAGTHVNFIYFIIQGNVQIKSLDRTRTYATLSPGSVFGDIYALTDTPSTYNYCFQEEAVVEVYRVEVTEFNRIFVIYPDSLKVLEKRIKRGRRYLRRQKQIAIEEFNEALASRQPTQHTNEEENMETYASEAGLFSGRDHSPKRPREKFKSIMQEGDMGQKGENMDMNIKGENIKVYEEQFLEEEGESLRDPSEDEQIPLGLKKKEGNKSDENKEKMEDVVEVEKRENKKVEELEEEKENIKNKESGNNMKRDELIEHHDIEYDIEDENKRNLDSGEMLESEQILFDVRASFGGDNVLPTEKSEIIEETKDTKSEVIDTKSEVIDTKSESLSSEQSSQLEVRWFGESLSTMKPHVVDAARIANLEEEYDSEDQSLDGLAIRHQLFNDIEHDEFEKMHNYEEKRLIKSKQGLVNMEDRLQELNRDLEQREGHLVRKIGSISSRLRSFKRDLNVILAK